MSNIEPVSWINANDKERWQPRCHELRLWVSDIGSTWNENGLFYGCYAPKLYRSKKRAERVGKRALTRRRRRYWMVAQ